IALKATLAQVLLEHAWARSAGGTVPIAPWPGADTWPVARLALPRQDYAAIVLAGASARNLAFGPAHLAGSGWPGDAQASLIAGHRDTHFSVLESLRSGDPVVLERAGRRHAYTVIGSAVVHQGAAPAAAPDELVLVTCWPFRALAPGTPWRYVVRAAPAR
ncbi:MAG: class GN sortase, partial [Gammaproteobacteria bacterium]